MELIGPPIKGVCILKLQSLHIYDLTRLSLPQPLQQRHSYKALTICFHRTCRFGRLRMGMMPRGVFMFIAEAWRRRCARHRTDDGGGSRSDGWRQRRRTQPDALAACHARHATEDGWMHTEVSEVLRSDHPRSIVTFRPGSTNVQVAGDTATAVLHLCCRALVADPPWRRC